MNLNKKMYVINGHDAPKGQYPWFARLAVNKEELLKKSLKTGGGVLIAPQWILTAAHVTNQFRKEANTVCLKSEEKFESVAGFNFYDLNNIEDDAIQIMEMEKIIFHPQAFGDFIGDWVDAALIKLKQPVNNIKPISLHKNLNMNEKKCTVIGFGVSYWKYQEDTDPTIKMLPNRLQEVETQVFSLQGLREKYPKVSLDEDAIEYYNYKSDILALNIMDTIRGKYKGTAIGDSGGPLFIETNQKNNYELVGIVKAGTVTPEGPSLQNPDFNVFVWVPRILEWIEATIAKN